MDERRFLCPACSWFWSLEDFQILYHFRTPRLDKQILLPLPLIENHCPICLVSQEDLTSSLHTGKGSTWWCQIMDQAEANMMPQTLCGFYPWGFPEVLKDLRGKTMSLQTLTEQAPTQAMLHWLATTEEPGAYSLLYPDERARLDLFSPPRYPLHDGKRWGWHGSFSKVALTPLGRIRVLMAVVLPVQQVLNTHHLWRFWQRLAEHFLHLDDQGKE